MESELFDMLVNVVLAYLLVRVIIWLLVSRVEAKLDQDLETLVTRVVDGMLVPVTVEVEGTQYLCYNSVTNEFVCQGVDITEIVTNFKSRYPGKKMALLHGDKTALDTLKQQMEVSSKV